jgi:hypothetical protein
VRSLFIYKELGECRGNWMMTLQEYYLEFKTTNIVKFQGLCKLVIEDLYLGDQSKDGWEEELSMCTHQPSYTLELEYSWYNDLKKYLQHGIAP